jgi:alpha-beta hydrolase superfamily lysophospholipase
MLYQQDARGDWGSMRETEAIKIGTEKLTMSDGCQLFLRSWNTQSLDVLLLLHGLGGHSGWYIDVGNALAERHINVYAVDHRGFGRSDGLSGHIDKYQAYIKDIHSIVVELHKRHPNARVYILGHSMGGIFAAHFAATYPELLTGVIFLNPWIQDPARLPLNYTIGIITGGLLRSRRLWQVAGGSENMTTNAEAVRMLQEDTFWTRKMTATFLLQILFMRIAVPKLAKNISIPALVLQAEQDKAITIPASRTFYEVLASRDKTWISYPAYAHDSQLEADHTQLDDDIVNWMHKHNTAGAE